MPAPLFRARRPWRMRTTRRAELVCSQAEATEQRAAQRLPHGQRPNCTSRAPVTVNRTRLSARHTR